MVELQTALAEQVRELAELSLTDDLTGLRNRRGFLTLAEQQLKLARNKRVKNGLMLMYVDIDGLKQINDRFGHAEGSRAIIEISKILKACFRDSDIIARLGGDEFTILAVEAEQNSGDLILDRLNSRLASYNTQRDHEYPLSFSVGLARRDPESIGSIEELIEEADHAMYEQKLSRRKTELI